MISTTLPQHQLLHPSPKTEGQQLAEQLKERTGFGTMRYEGVESSEQVGKTADVAVKLYDKQLEHNFILHVKMYELDDGSWRLTEITNLKELLKEREQATAAKHKQLNSKDQAELDAAVTAVPGTIAIAFQRRLVPFLYQAKHVYLK